MVLKAGADGGKLQNLMQSGQSITSVGEQIVCITHPLLPNLQTNSQ
jgi:hypothetical protein